MNLPDFSRRRWKKETTHFVTVDQVFKPQVKVRALHSLSGWADRDRKVKWEIAKGSIGCLDEDTAREFQAKGFIEILEGSVKPVSEAEAAEFLSQIKQVGLGVPNG